MNHIVFLIQCPDQKGLVARISDFFYKLGFSILDCQQHTDVERNEYFMRLKLDLDDLAASRRELEENFAAFGKPLKLSWSAHYSDPVQRVAILVGKTSHCLYDLLLRQQEGELRCEFPAIISNHPTLETVADKFGIPFHHLPVTKATKPGQEREILGLLDTYRIDLVVLARYMQILSRPLVEKWSGRIINIHHAFLPAFQGAKPYRRAHDRGVKMIGATAHYVTPELDEGPIIEQDVERVTHEYSADELRQFGRDVERVVLSRAVRAHLEHRVIVAENRTIVFSGGV